LLDHFKFYYEILTGISDVAVHDSIYLQFAQKIGLDKQRFETELNNPELLNIMIQNKEKLKQKYIFSVPTYVLNDELLPDYIHAEHIENILNRLLKNEID